MYKTGVIPAAGAGVRLHPYTEHIPKTLLRVGGKTLLERNLEIMRDHLGVSRVIIITGYLGTRIREAFGDGQKIGVRIDYVQCRNVDSGLAAGLYDVRDHIEGAFPVLLGDELYIGSDHSVFLDPPTEQYEALCGVKKSLDLRIIRRNYSLKMSNGKIVSVTEKPRIVENQWLGCGSYVFTPRIFEFIEGMPISGRTGRFELTDAIDAMARESGNVYGAELKGGYVNVNTLEDYRKAVSLYRKMEFQKNRVTLVIPAWNEEESIGHVLEECSSKVDEVIVADNDSTDRTAEIVGEYGARLVKGPFAGYGDALQNGMEAGTGEVLVLVEGDGSFSADDLQKILEYLKDADLVIGTRTVPQMVGGGAGMGWALRWGNIAAAKVLQVLWAGHGSRFSDLGCTYRALWREAYEEIRGRMVASGPAFSPEMMLEVLRVRGRIVEIPVTYESRIGGESKISRGWIGVIGTALQMLGLIGWKRLGRR